MLPVSDARVYICIPSLTQQPSGMVKGMPQVVIDKLLTSVTPVTSFDVVIDT